MSLLIPIGPHIAFLFRERSLDDNEAVQSHLMALQEMDLGLLLRAQREGVDAGELAALEAPHHVMSMFLNGARPGEKKALGGTLR